jgi:hypothetical protein
MTDIDLEYTPILTLISRPTRDTPEAALAAAIEDHFATGRHGWSYESCATAVVMSLPPGWCGHPDEYEEATAMAMNFGEGVAEGRKEAEAEIARLRAALAEIVAMERYVTSPTRLDLMVTLGRALDVAKGALGLLEPLAALAPSEP